MVVFKPNNGLSGSSLPPPSTPPAEIAAKRMEKLKLMDRWTAARDDRQGPLRSRWYRQQEMWGAQKTTMKALPWGGGGQFRGAKGGGRICFATGKGPTDLSCNEVIRQQVPGASYHTMIRVPTAHQGRHPDYILRSNETLRQAASPPSSPRPLEKVTRKHPTLAWKHETWGQQSPTPMSFRHTMRLSPSGEGLAPQHDIMDTGLASRVHTAAARKPWTAKRSLASPDRESMRLQTWETRRFAGTRRLSSIPHRSTVDNLMRTM